MKLLLYILAFSFLQVTGGGTFCSFKELTYKQIISDGLKKGYIDSQIDTIKISVKEGTEMSFNYDGKEIIIDKGLANSNADLSLYSQDSLSNNRIKVDFKSSFGGSTFNGNLIFNCENNFLSLHKSWLYSSVD